MRGKEEGRRTERGSFPSPIFFVSKSSFGAFLFLFLGSFNPLSVSNRGYAPGGNHTGWIQGRRKPHNSCFCLYFFLFATVLFCSSCLSLDPYLGCGWCTTTESCLARSSEKSLRPFFNEVQNFCNFQGSVPWWLASEGRPLSLRSLLHLHLAHQRTRHHPRHSASSLSHFLHK